MKKALLSSLRSKMLIYFGLLIALILAAHELVEVYGIPFTTFGGEYQEHQSKAFETLNLAADLNKERLLHWIKMRRDDTIVLSESTILRSSVAELRGVIRENSAHDRKGDELWTRVQKEKIYKALTQHLNLIKNTRGVYEAIQVADATSGTIIASTQDSNLGVSISGEHYFTRALSSGGIYIGIEKESYVGHKFALHFSSAIKSLDRRNDNEGEAVAVLIMHINTDDIMKPILHTGEGLGRTGEVLLVDEDGRILTPVKHPLADGTTARPLEYQIKSEPAMLAARGEEGAIAAEDYRGVPVLAAYRHITVTPETRSGMVVKRDQAEITAHLRKELSYTLLIELISLLISLGVVVVIARNLSRPLQILSRTARQVEAGDLSARVPVASSDEVGILARTFNSMINRVENWHRDLEEQVNTRTRELNKTNEELRMEITERKRAEEALEEERNLLGTMIDNIPDYIYVKDTESRYLLTNNAHAHFLEARTREGVVGKTVFELFPQELAEKYYADDQEVIRSGQPLLNREERSVNQEGKSVWNQTSKVPLRDSSGKIVGLIGIARDITERKRAEEKIKNTNRRLIKEMKEKEEFVRIVSHDLGAPVRNISGMAASIIRKYGGSMGDDVKDRLTRIQKNAEHELGLIQDLLELSRIKAQRERLKEVDLGGIVKGVGDELSHQLEEKGIRFEIAENLPTVFCERKRMMQVFLNLIDNACKYMDSNGDPRIEVGFEELEDSYKFSVSDNGIGIREEDQEKIFYVFHRLRNPTTSKVDGKGVGLSAAKAIVEAYGGEVWVESPRKDTRTGKEAKGSTFYFTLAKDVLRGRDG